MTHSEKTRPVDEGFLVLDYGSQYTLLIARRLRELGYYAEVIDGRAEFPPRGFKSLGLILSGGPDSVTNDEGRRLPAWVTRYEGPILGICYGLQLLAQHFGAKIQSGQSREYGRASLDLDAEMVGPAAKVFFGLPATQTVWMSHGDDISTIPDELLCVGKTADGVVGAIVHRQRPVVGLQFHPEVKHSEYGQRILHNFAKELSRAQPNWDSGCMVRSALDYCREAAGDGNVLVACSGGVDSTVTAALLQKALPRGRVTPVLCDHGLMRKGEVEWVSRELRVLGCDRFEVLNRREAFLDKLVGVTDPEEKRKSIGLQFIEEFESFARSDGSLTHLAQGTLYPDVIESAGHGAGAKVIKSHHNVGGLPERLELKLVEPLRYLFKDEVRMIGEALGLPHELVHRHPFPGPGLGIRIMGEITAERLRVLREADHTYICALREAGLYDQVWQAFAVLLPVKSVGVMGDNRTYQMTIALRAVGSSDAMTAEVSNLPLSFLSDVAAAIVKRVDGVNRVVYDITTKPPATIEWE